MQGCRFLRFFSAPAALTTILILIQYTQLVAALAPRFDSQNFPTALLLRQTTDTTSSESTSVSSTSSSTSSTSASSSSSTTHSSTSGTATSSAVFPSLSGYSTCVATCLTDAIASANCSSVVAVDCFCQGNSLFAASYANCVYSGCSGQLSSAETLAEEFCALASTSTSLAFSTVSLTSTSSTPSSTSSSSVLSSTSTTSSTTHETTSSSSTSASASATSVSNDALAWAVPGWSVFWGLASIFFGIMVR